MSAVLFAAACIAATLVLAPRLRAALRPDIVVVTEAVPLSFLEEWAADNARHDAEAHEVSRAFTAAWLARRDRPTP